MILRKIICPNKINFPTYLPNLKSSLPQASPISISFFIIFCRGKKRGKNHYQKIMLTDSLGKYLKNIKKTTIIAKRGAKIEDLTKNIDNNKTCITGYGATMLLVGTNNVETNTPTQMIEKYKKLTDTIQREHNNGKIICFAIPPRPKDYHKIDDRVTSFNTLLKKLAREKKYTFVNIYKKIHEPRRAKQKIVCSGWATFQWGEIKNSGR